MTERGAKSNEAGRKRLKRIQDDHSLSKLKTTKAIARHGAELAAKWKKRTAFFKEQRKTIREVGSEFLRLVSKDALTKADRAMQERAKRFRNVKLKPPSTRVAQPRITSGSLISVLVPPYYNIWTWTNGGGDLEPDADEAVGTFGASSIQGGGSGGAAGGVMAAYRPISDQPVGHFRPYLRYSFTYYDYVDALSTAHATGTLNAAVYEFDERGNLANYPPAVSSVSLFDDTTGPNFFAADDTNSGDNVWPGVIDVQFQFTPGFSYGLWAWCEVYADAGPFGAAYGEGEVSCPFMVVEEAQV